ncbi:RimJ/RimL family protein N-acetyltransferase [Geodermatophilus bullaregiensis]|uniref:GNAT family N-acetyltransferase n=1 Tax=Geodermatophilus bullaregiensis TaxID=1564160 RepID=UPI001957D717|nr:GNAT family N-acetyltransferase [Geodermatophilus bullaregiensis]MBM7805931.1 RimJ/RimL family protein N-acetyltransferase [Geodermatophilus bullaregiensis]
MRRPVADAVETPRLRLEPLAAAHAAELHPVLADPALYAFTGGAPPTLAGLRARHARQLAGASPDGSQGWLDWVLRLRDTGAAAGFVQATLTRGGGVLAADLAWLVGTAVQGRGLATEAAVAVAGRLRARGVVRLGAWVHPDHAASGAVARRCGLAPTAEVRDGEVRWAG